MVTRKTFTVAALATAVVTAPLAALRPVAEAQAAMPTPTVVTTDQGNSRSASRRHLNAALAIRQKTDFAAAVRAYNSNLARVYYDLDTAIGQYEKAVAKDQPGRISSLLASGYTFNNQPQDAAQSVAALGARIRQYGGDGYALHLTSANIVPAIVRSRSVTSAPELPPVPPYSSRMATVSMESWYSHAQGKTQRSVFLRRDVWKVMPRKVALLTTQVTFIKRVLVPGIGNVRHNGQ